MSAPNPYVGMVAGQVRRALALIDRTDGSPTRGCADRPFWQYRSLTDFAGGSWQQVMLALALAYRTEHPDNPWANDPAVLDATAAALDWWSHLAHGDGSFDEWYRNERSYCPAAFTAAGAAQVLELVGDRLPGAVKTAGEETLARAGAWLKHRRNPATMNQNLAAAVALWGLGRLTGDGRWGAAAEERIAFVATRASDEGWLAEYGGCDFGYSTLALDLLAAADRLGAADAVRPMASRLCAFLRQAQGAGPGYPGRLGSRGTAHVFPFGAEHFAAGNADAAALAATWRTWHARRLVAGPADVDDRYFAYFYLPQFAQAMAWAPETLPAPPTAEAETATDLPDGGFLVRRRAGAAVVISRRLGGALAVEDGSSPPRYDLGWEIGLGGGVRLSSASWGEGPVAPAGDTEAIRTEAAFRPVSQGQPLVRWGPAFALFTRLLAWTRLAEAVQRLIKSRMIAPRSKPRFRLTREIAFADTGISVTDTIVRLPGAPDPQWVRPAVDIACHSPSARQDATGTLAQSADWDAAAAARTLAGGSLTVERTIPWLAEGLTAEHPATENTADT